MELLGAYSDDSDNEKEPVAGIVEMLPVHQAKSRPAIHAGAAGTQNKHHKKKRKKLDISFLPENIQTALARGDTNRDSDSEGETAGGAHVPIASKTFGGQPNVPALLMMLPKPKHDEPIVCADKDSPFHNSVTKSKPSQIQPSHIHSGALSPRTGHDTVTVEEASSDSDSERNSDGDIDDSKSDSSSVHVLSSAPALVASLPLPKPAAQSLPPPPGSTCRQTLPTGAPQIRLPSFSSAPEVTSTIRVAPTSAPQIPVYSAASSQHKPHSSMAHPRHAQYDSYPSQSSSSSISSSAHARPQSSSYATSASASSISTSSASLKGNPPPRKSAAANRKRERDIHLGLLQGDTSVIEMEGNFVDVRPSNEWDNSAYIAQQERQRELQSMFNFTEKGGDKMMSQPTKLQNKRHQINSLAFSAAESELDLLEAKGRQMKTKSETQAKYGW
jgi:hypothetical protein